MPAPALTINGPAVNVCWNSRSDYQYQVQYCSELTTNQWVDWGVPIPGNGTTNCITEALSHPARYYRVVTLP